jgi:hypothetical protein
MGHSPDGGSSSSVAPATIGAGAGGILVGVFAGAFGILAFRRWRRSRRSNRHRENTPARDSLLSSDSPHSNHQPSSPLRESLPANLSTRTSNIGGLRHAIRVVIVRKWLHDMAPPPPHQDASDGVLALYEAPRAGGLGIRVTLYCIMSGCHI